MSPSQFRGCVLVLLRTGGSGGAKGGRGLATSASHSSPSQSDDLPSSTSRLSSLRRGPGYRSSFSGTVATVFGASGMVGRSVCNRLGQQGTQLILPYRGDHYRYMRFKPYGDLGQVLFTPYNLRDEEAIRRSMKYSNVVINLIGREYETRNFTFRDVNVEGPRLLARIARESGVKKFVHISHINAREEPQRLWTTRGSPFLRTKWEGEMAVLEEFPDATIFRPADIYGIWDDFIHHYFTWGRSGFRNALPLYKRGEETVKAPLHFSDLGAGVMAALSDPAAAGTIYEAYGPERYLASDLFDWMAEATNRDPTDYNYRRTELRLSPYVWWKTLFFQTIPVGNKFMGTHTLERLERTSLSDEILGLPNLQALGVKPAKVTEKMIFEMWPYRAFAHYVPDNVEEQPNPADPRPLDDYEYKQVLRANRSSLLKQLGFA